jgi:hypothetical protein
VTKGKRDVRRTLIFGVLITALTFVMLGGMRPVAAAAQTVVSCPFDPTGGGDDIGRGFYVTGYPGTNIDQVTLEYGAGGSGTYAVTLTARSGTYNGPIIAARTASVSPANSSATTPLTFAFGGTPVAFGSTITFTQTKTGPGNQVFYNVPAGLCPGVIETNGTTPPLDTPTGSGVGLTITQASPPTPAGPTGQRAGALKKCKKKHSKKARRKCRKKAQLLPV